MLELACNMEVPKGGEGWQQLRQGILPSEFTSGKTTGSVGGCVYTYACVCTKYLQLFACIFLCLCLCLCVHICVRTKYLYVFLCVCVCVVGLSPELQHVLRLMLASEPSRRPSAEQLLSLPSVRKHSWRRHVCLLLHESLQALLSYSQVLRVCVYMCYKLLN